VRAAVGELQRWIEHDPRWDDRFRKAPLVRATVACALDAPPGPLYDLSGQLVADLMDVPALPSFASAAAQALQDALSTLR
jgi:hypothetical protein